MKRRSSFTLLELLVAVVILSTVGSLVGWKISQLIQRQRFQSDVGKLTTFLFQGRALAINTRSDWVLSVRKIKDRWQVALVCREDPEGFKGTGAPVTLQRAKLTFENRSFEELNVVFYSSGKVEPEGVLRMASDGSSKRHKGKKQTHFRASSKFTYCKNRSSKWM